MKGARALASGVFVLATVCAVPALSAAQDAGMTTTDVTTTTPADPVGPEPSATTPDASSEGAAAGTPPEAPEPSSEITDDVRPVEPADAPSDGASVASSPKARKSASASVSVGDNFYSPASVSIAVGDTVTWRNNGQAPHSATADDGSFDTGVFQPGSSRSHTFTRAGTFSYYCTVHGQVQSGTVRVLAASGGGGGGGGGASGPEASATGDSEASAVASPDAAGDSNTLPATGLAAGALALVGVALVASGLATRVAGRWLSIF